MEMTDLGSIKKDDSEPTSSNSVTETKSSGKATTWKEFTQNTTLHGLKYIFDRDSPFLLRRILWLTFVVASLVVFMAQTGTRILSYYERKTTVDVQVLYTETVEFPAVTVCNQNMFRMTKVAELGLYANIDKLFSRAISSTLDQSELMLPNMTSESFMEFVAHKKQDMIDSCTWNGEPCNVETDFTTTLTDIGICHTFNKRQPPRDVTEPGSGFGLSLVLNLEQYEYMRGPENDAGAKVLLHHQSEHPRIKELGFGVAPGTHTLVGVKRAQMMSLPEPYGDCLLVENNYRSQCQAECAAHYIMDKCQCVDFFMETFLKNNSEPCTIYEALTCVQEILGTERSQINCTCPVSCQTIVYEPSLSYVRLSRFNLDKMILNDPYKKAHFEKRYLLARETSQRVIQSNVDEDAKMIGNIRDTYGKFVSLLNASLSLGDLTQYAVQHSLVPIIDEGATMISKEKHYLSNSMKLAEGKILMLNEVFDLYVTYSIITEFEVNFLEIGDAATIKSVLSERLKLCSMNLTKLGTSHSPDILNKYNNRKPGSYFLTLIYIGYDNHFEESDCDRYLFYKQLHASYLSEDITVAKKELRNIRSPMMSRIIYDLYIDIIFRSSWLNPDNVQGHRDCIKASAEYNPTGIESQLDFVQISLDAFNDASTVQGLLNNTLSILESMEKNGFLKNDYGLRQLHHSCSWSAKCIYTKTTDYQEFIHFMERAEEQFHLVAGLMANIYSELVATNVVLSGDFAVVMKGLQSYAENQTSKFNLSEIMTLPSLSRSLGNLIDRGNSLGSLAGQFRSAMRAAVVNLREAFAVVYNFTLPLMKTDVVSNMTIVQHVAKQNLSEFASIMEEIKSSDGKSTEGALVYLFETITESHIEIITQLEKNVTSSILKFRTNLWQYRQQLKEYADECEINQHFFLENFLQLDVFYTDLVYDRVEQHAAIEAGALLGDIGGFLGLLVGASVLTVCEILDYLLIKLATGLSGEKKKSSSSSKGD